MAADGRFRRDLYYRLNVFEIAVPPLRERGGDLGLLVDHLVRRFSRELGKDVHDVPQETLATLRRYPWPGNVRELQNVLKQALVTAAGPSLRPEFLPAIVREPDAVPAPPGPDPTGLAGFVRERLAVGATDMYAEVIGRVERVLFLEALAHAGYNLSRAARTLGISRTTLRAKMAALGIALDRTTVIESPAGDGP
jgi:two-component system nitrogen regulation response regulator GlnG